jgi:hypothetical protein
VPTMRRVVLDSNAVDPLIGLPGALDCLRRAVAAGHLEVMFTHITTDENGNTPDVQRQSQLLDALWAIGRKVATGAAAWDASRWDEARWFDGRDYDDLKRGNTKYTNDALIGVTARVEKCALVTCDKTLTTRAKELDVEVLTMPDLLREFGLVI